MNGYEFFRQYKIECQQDPNFPAPFAQLVTQDRIQGELEVDESGCGFGNGKASELTATYPTIQQPGKPELVKQFITHFHYDITQDTYSLNRRLNSGHVLSSVFSWVESGHLSDDDTTVNPQGGNPDATYFPNFYDPDIWDWVEKFGDWVESDWMVDMSLPGDLMA